MRYIIFYYFVILKQITTTSAQLRFRPMKAIRSFQTSNDFRNDRFQGERQTVYNTTRSRWFQSVRPAASANPVLRVRDPIPMLSTVRYSPSLPVLTQRLENIRTPIAPVLRRRPIGMPTSVLPNFGNTPTMLMLHPTPQAIKNFQGQTFPILPHPSPANFRNTQSQTKLFMTVPNHTMPIRIVATQTTSTQQFRNKQVLPSQLIPMLRNTVARAMPVGILRSKPELSRDVQKERIMRTGVLLKRGFNGEPTESFLPLYDNVEPENLERRKSIQTSEEDFRSTAKYKGTKRRLFVQTVSTKPPYSGNILPPVKDFSGDYYILTCEVDTKCHRHVWKTGQVLARRKPTTGF